MSLKKFMMLMAGSGGVITAQSINGTDIYLTWPAQTADSLLLQYSTDQSNWTDVPLDDYVLGYNLIDATPGETYYFRLYKVLSDVNTLTSSGSIALPSLHTLEPTGEIFDWTKSKTIGEDWDVLDGLGSVIPVFTPTIEGVRNYNHHNCIAKFNGVLYHMTSVANVSEEQRGMWVDLYYSLDDGDTWTHVSELIPPLDNEGPDDGTGEGLVVIPMTFVKIDNELYAVADVNFKSDVARTGIGFLAVKINSYDDIEDPVWIHNTSDAGEPVVPESGFPAYEYSEIIRSKVYRYLDRPGYKPKTNFSDTSLSVTRAVPPTPLSGTASEPTDIRPYRYDKIRKYWKYTGGLKIIDLDYALTGFFNSVVPDVTPQSIVTRFWQFSNNVIFITGNSNDGDRRRLYLAVTIRRPSDGYYETVRVYQLDYSAAGPTFAGAFKQGGPQIINWDFDGNDIYFGYNHGKEDVKFLKATLPTPLYTPENTVRRVYTETNLSEFAICEFNSADPSQTLNVLDFTVSGKTIESVHVAGYRVVIKVTVPFTAGETPTVSGVLNDEFGNEFNFSSSLINYISTTDSGLLVHLNAAKSVTLGDGENIASIGNIGADSGIPSLTQLTTTKRPDLTLNKIKFTNTNLDFLASSAYTSLKFQPSNSFSVVVKGLTNAKTNGYIFSTRGQSTVSNAGWYITWNVGGTLLFAVSDGSLTKSKGYTFFPLTERMDFILIWDNGTITIYDRTNASVGSATSGSIGASITYHAAAQFCFGIRNPNESSVNAAWSGDIWEGKIFNRALSEAERDEILGT